MLKVVQLQLYSTATVVEYSIIFAENRNQCRNVSKQFI